MLNQLFFGYFAFMIVLTSILVVSQKNPVHSILWMLLMFFHVAGMYLFMTAEFIAAIQIIVYAGAILVLFLFVVFLLDFRREVGDEQFVGAWPLGLTAAIAILTLVILSVMGLSVTVKGPYGIEEITRTTNAVALGKVLYTEYLYPFEVSSLILLVAIVGAVLLAKKSKQEEEE